VPEPRRAGRILLGGVPGRAVVRLEGVFLSSTVRRQADPRMPKAETPDTGAQAPERAEVDRDCGRVGLEQRVGGGACPGARGDNTAEPHPPEPGHREVPPGDRETVGLGGRANTSGREVGHDRPEQEPDDHDRGKDDEDSAQAGGHTSRVA
jgi:hypothetical protein